MPDEVPAAVARLLRECIEDYEHLEALLLFVRAPRGRMWTPSEVTAALNVPESAVTKTLADLVRSGLLRSSRTAGGPVFDFQPNQPWLQEAAEGLAAQFETNRIAIMKRMNANALARVRGDALRSFADAFVLRRKKDDG